MFNPASRNVPEDLGLTATSPRQPTGMRGAPGRESTAHFPWKSRQRPSVSDSPQGEGRISPCVIRHRPWGRSRASLSHPSRGSGRAEPLSSGVRWQRLLSHPASSSLLSHPTPPQHPRLPHGPLGSHSTGIPSCLRAVRGAGQR